MWVTSCDEATESFKYGMGQYLWDSSRWYHQNRVDLHPNKHCTCCTILFRNVHNMFTFWVSSDLGFNHGFWSNLDGLNPQRHQNHEQRYPEFSRGCIIRLPPSIHIWWPMVSLVIIPTGILPVGKHLGVHFWTAKLASLASKTISGSLPKNRPWWLKKLQHGYGASRRVKQK